MSTLTFPGERFPAPPSVSLDVPDDWEPVSVPSVVLAAKASGEHPEFTPNVIVRVGTRPGLDQPADALMELAGSLEGRADAQIGTPEPVEVGGTTFHRCDVSWTDPRGVAIRQTHLFAGLPREDGLQDFVHVTGSRGGRPGADDTVVAAVLDSVKVTR
ncbi:MAG TPA: hypothetical protein VH915_02035 [Pedococcus sp.]|jgi:hypothetical protein